MPAKRNPKRWLIKRLGKVSAATAYELAVASGRPETTLSAIWALQATGHIKQDSFDHHYRLTDLGQETLMRIRSKKKVPDAVVNLAAERERLIADFHGPHALAITTVEDDPVLSERLALAIERGLSPIDLSATPLHRRPQVVEDALAAFQAATAGGPCGFCGTLEKRRSPEPISHLDPQVVPGFVTMHEHPACAWCAWFLASRTIQEFRELVGNAVAGVIGVPIVGEYRWGPSLVPFAFEVKQITGTHYSGAPWAWLTGPLAEEIYDRAQKVVHKNRFVTSEAQIRIVGMPGIKTRVWDRAELKTERKFFTTLAEQVRYAEETAELEKRRAQAAYDREHKYDMYNRNKEALVARQAEKEQALHQRARNLGVL